MTLICIFGSLYHGYDLKKLCIYLEREKEMAFMRGRYYLERGKKFLRGID